MTVTNDFFGRLIDFDGTCTYLSEGHIIISSVQIKACNAEVLANWWVTVFFTKESQFSL